MIKLICSFRVVIKSWQQQNMVQELLKHYGMQPVLKTNLRLLRNCLAKMVHGQIANMAELLQVR